MNTAGRVLRFAGFQRTVGDLERAIDFYSRALGFLHELTTTQSLGERGEPARRAHLRLGDETIELVSPVGFERHAGEDRTEADVAWLGFQHLAIVARDIDEAMHRLRRYSPTFISAHGAVTLPANSGGVTACKFKDPDGHPLELIAFPPGTGNPRWQTTQHDGVTLGLDHSAIAVSQVEQSTAFYAALGFAEASRQLNRGPEQDSLDGVATSVVDVVALRPVEASSPHLELLGYRTPAPMARSSFVSAEDDLSDCLLWKADDLAALASRLGMDLPAHGLLLRDPDGHRLLLR